jgi:hypothetical protein
VITTLERPASGIPDTERSEHGVRHWQFICEGVDTYGQEDFPEESDQLVISPKFRAQFLNGLLVRGLHPQPLIGKTLGSGMKEEEICNSFGGRAIFEHDEAAVRVGQMLDLHLIRRQIFNPGVLYLLLTEEFSIQIVDTSQISPHGKLTIVAQPWLTKTHHFAGSCVIMPDTR